MVHGLYQHSTDNHRCTQLRGILERIVTEKDQELWEVRAALEAVQAEAQVRWRCRVLVPLSLSDPLAVRNKWYHRHNEEVACGNPCLVYLLVELKREDAVSATRALSLQANEDAVELAQGELDDFRRRLAAEVAHVRQEAAEEAAAAAQQTSVPLADYCRQ